MISSEGSEEAQVDFGSDLPSKQTLWHCLELCRLYADCAWVSRKYEAEEVGHECRLMKELPNGNTMVGHTVINSGWVSSHVNCAMVEYHFERKSVIIGQVVVPCFPAVF